MMRIESNQQPTRRNNAKLMLATASGAVVGAASRFVLPTKKEFGAIKNATDTCFSSKSTMARGANRSILKYAGVGALIAAGIHTLAKMFKKPEKEATNSFYSQYQAIIDAPEYACEILLYED